MPVFLYAWIFNLCSRVSCLYLFIIASLVGGKIVKNILNWLLFQLIQAVHFTIESKKFYTHARQRL